MLVVIAVGIFIFLNKKYRTTGHILLDTGQKTAGSQPSQLTNSVFVSRIVLKQSQAPEQENIIIKKMKGLSPVDSNFIASI